MSRTKGNRRERQAEELYERAGFATFRPQESKFGETDMYGLFDILALPPTGSTRQVRLVQVKSNGATGIEDWGYDALALASKHVCVEMLVCYDGHGGPHATPPRWRLVEPFQHGGGTDHRTVLDEREIEASDGDGVVSYLEGGDGGD